MTTITFFNQLTAMPKRLAMVLTVLFTLGVGSILGETTTLTQSIIYSTGTPGSGYATHTFTVDGRSWSAYAIKNKHSNATSSQHYLQIKKYESNTAYYIQIPTVPGNITSIKMTVGSTQKPMSDGGNTATLYFSSKNSTKATGTGVVSGTGDKTVTLDCSSLNLTSGYITASAGVRIWDVAVTYETAAATKYTVNWHVNSTKEYSQTATTGTTLTNIPNLDDYECNGKVFVGWTIQSSYSSATTAPTGMITNTSGMTMPEGGEDYNAVFATETGGGSTTDTYDWESTSTENWTVDSNIARTASQGVNSSYAGKISTANTYVTYTKKVAVTEFSFDFKRATNNTNYNVYIETSTDKNTWSTAATYAMSTFGNGSYTSKSQTFDGNTELYVRFHCYNTTATRYVDNVSITYGGGTTYTDYTTTCTTKSTVFVIPKCGGDGGGTWLVVIEWFATF